MDLLVSYLFTKIYWSKTSKQVQNHWPCYMCVSVIQTEWKLSTDDAKWSCTSPTVAQQAEYIL
jgi:hypothetical protein